MTVDVRVLLVAIAFPAMVTAETVTTSELSLPRLPPSPLSTFVAFEVAWSAGDLPGVIALLPHGPVELALDRAGAPQGSFPRAQAEFLIRDLLEYAPTAEFVLVSYAWKGVAGGEVERPVALGAWRRSPPHDDDFEHVEIELSWDGNAWRLSRIAVVE